MAKQQWRSLTVSLPSFITSGAHHEYALASDSTELQMRANYSNDNLVPKPSNVSKDSKASSTLVGHYRQRVSGFKSGVLQFAICAAVVFLINLVVTIWGSVAYKTNGGALDQGDCGRIKTLNSGLHVLINILSTVLLSGSNYCMQCMTAPTRKEVDTAHAEKTWLDIGVPSLRNLGRISRRRLILWLFLGLSSIPLHLLYNSAVYVSLSTNSYSMFVVNTAFIDDPVCQNCTDLNSDNPEYPAIAAMLKSVWTQTRNNELEKLSPVECLRAYESAIHHLYEHKDAANRVKYVLSWRKDSGVPATNTDKASQFQGTLVQSTKRNLLIVTSENDYYSSSVNPDLALEREFNNTNFYRYSYFDAKKALTLNQNQRIFDELQWLCSGLPGIDTPCINKVGELLQAPQSWTVGSTQWPVEYCLSESVDLQCKLHFNSVIAVTVTILNFFKAVLMFYIAYTATENPLITFGDAIASFIDERDSTTIDMGPVGVRDIKKRYTGATITWSGPRWRWKDATSKKRRATTLLLFVAAIGLVLGLLIWAVDGIKFSSKISTSDVFHFSFGAVDTRALIYSSYLPTNMEALALIANSPQLILSFLYFAYNGLFTAMLGAYEWISYAHKRKGLRLSHKPSGAQRSTYFLQLPYRFGVPLVVLSGALHWLVSQSIFIVAFDVYNEHGELQTTGVGLDYNVFTRTCGYSPIAMLAVIIFGVAMVFAVIAFGYIPYKGGMPLVGSCSLAISAACHPDKQSNAGDIAMSVEELQWGVVSTDADGIGHCAFSSGDVGPIVKGRTYR